MALRSLARGVRRNLCSGLILALAAASVLAADGEPEGCRYGFFWHDTTSPTPAFPGQTRAPRPAIPSSYRVEVLAEGLHHPWSLAFLPDGRMLITEREGRLRLLDAHGRLSGPLAGLPPLKSGPPGGLWDVIVDPDFAHNRTIYFNYYSPPTSVPVDAAEAEARWSAWLKLLPAERRRVDEGSGHVARARLVADGSGIEQLTNLVDGNLEGRLRFTPDGNLLITSGTPAGPMLASDVEPQDIGNAYGKILRIRPDGSIPADNPFVGIKGARLDLYAYGLRDVQGAAIQPGTGDLWTSENGPRGGDEINRIRPGDNLGYPIVSYGREYSGALVNGGLTAREGLAQPVYFWTPSIAPSGIAFYDGSLFPHWQGNLFVAALAGKRLERLILTDGHVVAEEPLLLERCQRLRAVYQGPEGALYVLTDEDQGQVLRVLPTVEP